MKRYNKHKNYFNLKKNTIRCISIEGLIIKLPGVFADRIGTIKGPSASIK